MSDLNIENLSSYSSNSDNENNFDINKNYPNESINNSYDSSIISSKNNLSQYNISSPLSFGQSPSNFILSSSPAIISQSPGFKSPPPGLTPPPGFIPLSPDYRSNIKLDNTNSNVYSYPYIVPSSPNVILPNNPSSNFGIINGSISNLNVNQYNFIDDNNDSFLNSEQSSDDITEYENDEEILEETKKNRQENSIITQLILERAGIKIKNNKSDYEINSIDIILSTMINIILISSIEILNRHAVTIEIIIKYINENIYIFNGENIIINQLDKNDIKKHILTNKNIYKKIKINDTEYVTFSDDDKFLESILNNKNLPTENFSKNIELLMKGINNPEILKNNSNFKSIERYVQIFPMYKNLLSDLLEILLYEEEMEGDLLESEIISLYNKGFYSTYYKFLIYATKDFDSFLTKCPSHKNLFKKVNKINDGMIFNYYSINNSYFDNIDYQKEISNIIQKDHTDYIKLILILNFIIGYGEFYNNNQFILLKEIQDYLKQFTNMTDDNIELYIKNKCKDSLDINPNYSDKIVSLHFSNFQEQTEQTNNSDVILKELFNNLIYIFNNKIVKYREIDYISNYIELYPFINEFKDYIIKYLSEYKFYDQEKNIYKYVILNVSDELKNFFQYYKICCNGFKNLLSNFKNLEFHDFHKTRFYKYISSSSEKDETNDITPNINLDREITETVRKMLPTDEDYNRLNIFKERVSDIITKKWPSKNLRVHSFGSAVNGLWSNKSDVDLCIFADSEGEYNEVQKLAKVLRKGRMKDVTPIKNARIPICKFKDPKTGFNCDLSVNNRIPINNSELIRCYMDLDERVRDIIMIIKKWSKCRGINDSKNHTFCSYSYVLLCISFFQNINPPVLPNLQNPKAFPELRMEKKTVDVSYKLINKNFDGTFKLNICYYKNYKEVSRYFKSTNDMTRSELLIKLFQFYGCIFKYKNSNISSSIRTDGGFDYNFNKDRNNNRIGFAVQDPFIEERDTISNSNVEEKTHIINEFYRAYKILKKKDSNLNEIFEND